MADELEIKVEPIKVSVPATPAVPPLRPDTTHEQDLHTATARKINMIWECTQGVIAVFVTLATLFVASTMSLRGDGGTAAFLLLSNAFFLVIGFYFSRTNHSRTGGTEDIRK